MQMHFALRATIILQLLNSILITALPSTNLARHHQRSPSHSTNLLKVDERDSALPSNLFKRINYLALGNIFDVVEDLGTGWVVYYNVLDFALTTVVPSDSDLIHFYSGVLSLAGNVWAGEAPSATRGASMGGISLTLESMEPIPWDFIEWFLITAIGQTHLGQSLPDGRFIMPASYVLRFINTAAASVITAKLKLPIPGAAPAAR